MIQSAEFSKTDVDDTAEKTPIRVLHVDDDAGFLKTAKQILEMQGECARSNKLLLGGQT